MLQDSFVNSSTHAQPPGQAPSSSPGDFGEENTANNASPSSLEFQGSQYEFSQPRTQYPAYASPQAPPVAPNIQSAFWVQHPLETPVDPRNVSEAYRGAPSRGNIPNHAAGTSDSWGRGSHPAIPAQQAQTNDHREQAREAGTSFAVNPQNVTATTFPVPPPPGVYNAPNAAQGMYAALWQLHDVGVEAEGTEYLRLVIKLRMLPTQSG